jgi:hypothetical protein
MLALVLMLIEEKFRDEGGVHFIGVPAPKTSRPVRVEEAKNCRSTYPLTRVEHTKKNFLWELLWKACSGSSTGVAGLAGLGGSLIQYSRDNCSAKTFLLRL